MNSEALKLLKDLLSIPSVNGADNEKNIAEYVSDYFKNHHVESFVQDIDDTHANVIAFVPGKNPDKTIIWNGHLDTVPYGNLDEWSTNPSVVTKKDGRLYARGASDMKSGLAAMVYALCHAKEQPSCNIQFLGTCDEEKNGIGAEAVKKAGLMKPADCMLVGEPTDMHLGVAQKGCLWLELLACGKTSHGAYPEQGISAIHIGMELAQRICEYVRTYSHELLGGSTAHVTMIDGGIAPNMTADRCRFVLDIRMVPGLTSEMIFGETDRCMKEIAKRNPGFHATWKSLNERRAIEIKSDDPLVLMLHAELVAAGYEGSDIGINFFTDASILDREDQKKILLFGPGDPAMAHKPNEYVEIQKFEDAIYVLDKFLTDCAFLN